MSKDEHPDSPANDAPLGGDEITEENLEADNPVEEETLQAVDPDQAPA